MRGWKQLMAEVILRGAVVTIVALAVAAFAWAVGVMVEAVARMVA